VSDWLREWLTEFWEPCLVAVALLVSLGAVAYIVWLAVQFAS